jgi:hypothetical protein
MVRPLVTAVRVGRSPGWIRSPWKYGVASRRSGQLPVPLHPDGDLIQARGTRGNVQLLDEVLEGGERVGRD